MSRLPPPLAIDPPLVNSANPWASTLEDLKQLYACTYTGAVTTRTSLYGNGFPHDPSQHDFVFLDSVTHKSSSVPNTSHTATVNTFGYSPYPLDQYIEWIRTIDQEHNQQGKSSKGFIVSVTGTPEEVAKCYQLLVDAQQAIRLPLAMEINLSCPNIPGKTPPAYSCTALVAYLEALRRVMGGSTAPRLPFGLKTPPYTHTQQFKELVDALLEDGAAPGAQVSTVSFITSTNTLGHCLVLDSTGTDTAELEQALPGLGGMAGAPLHPLALGNVSTIRRLLDETGLSHIQIVGTGGVVDTAGYRRMRHAGAAFVGVGTGLGLHGVDIFKAIGEQLT